MKWIQEWRKDVKELEVQVKDIKSRLRKDWTRYPTETETVISTFTKQPSTYRKFTPEKDQWQLLVLKHQLTHFYQYRAAWRKKTHVVDLPVGAYGLSKVTPDMAKYNKLLADELAEREELRKKLQTLADLEIIGEVELAHQ